MIGNEYSDYFLRLSDLGVDEQYYTQSIREPSGMDSQRWNLLYGESFGHHVSPYIPPTEGRLRLDVRGARWITRDQLTSRFIHNYYQVPPIYQTDDTNLEDIIHDDEVDPLSFQEFVDKVTYNPITNENELGFRAGSNNVSFLLGNIGKGKSIFATKLYCELKSNLYNAIKEGGNEWLVVVSHNKLQGKSHAKRSQGREVLPD